MRGYYNFCWGIWNLHFSFGAYSNPIWFGKRRAFHLSTSEPHNWEGTCENEETQFQVRNHSWYLVLWWFTVFFKCSVYKPARIDGVPR
jgi:hypothetical protein